MPEEKKPEENTKPKKKKRGSINLKTFIVIFILIFGTALVTISNSTSHHLFEMLRWHLDRARLLSLGNASLFQDPDLPKLAKFIRSDEFKAVRDSAKEENGLEEIDKLFIDSELWRLQEESWRHLQDLEYTYDMSEVIVVECDMDRACWFITSGYDGRKLQGSQMGITFLDHEEDDDGVISVMENIANVERIDGRFYPAHELYTLAASKIGTDEGKTYWLVSIGDTYPIYRQLIDYVKRMAMLLLIVTAIVSLLGMFIMRAGITSPIIRLKKNAERFALENSVDHAAQPYRSHIRTNDELEDLSDSLYDLEKNVAETQAELKQFAEERGREKAQLSIAADIQYGVLPNVFPEDEDFDIYAMMLPAKEVGGDLYDFFRVGEDHMILVIGDVSDKGIPAALFMMTAKTLLKTYAQMDTDPAKILTSVNKILVDSNPAGMFVTVWIGDFNLKTGLLTAASAGHEYPLFQFGDGEFEVYKDPHGMVLGCLENMVYKNYEIQLHRGDRMLVYSDGAPDAVNSEGVHYGLDHLLEAVRKAAASEPNARGLISGVLSEINEYSRNAPQFDDITMLAFEYKKNDKETDS